MYNIIRGQQRTQYTEFLSGTLFSQGHLTTLPALDTKTLIFTRPGVTVTFVAPATLDAVVTQINAQVQAVDAEFTAYWKKEPVAGTGTIQHQLALRSGNQLGVVMANTGTANADLKFSTTASHPSLESYRISRNSMLDHGISADWVPFAVIEGRGAVLNYFSPHSAKPISAVLRAAPCRWIEGTIINRTGGDLFFQLHDSAIALVGNPVPKISIPIANTERLSLVPAEPYGFNLGLTFGWSTTEDTYTAAGAGGTTYATYGF